MKKLLTLLITGGLLMGSVAGCGDAKDKPKDKTTPPVTTPPVTPPPEKPKDEKPATGEKESPKPPG